MNIRHVAGCPCLPGRLVVPGKSSTSIKDRGGLIVSMKSEYPSVQPTSKAAPMLMKKMLQCMFCKQLIKEKQKTFKQPYSDYFGILQQNSGVPIQFRRSTHPLIQFRLCAVHSECIYTNAK